MENGEPKRINMAQNPVENPPMNNWSVNQPSPPHATGMAGNEDLDIHMVVNGTPVRIAQKEGNWGEGMNGNEDLGMDMRVAPTYHSPDTTTNRINAMERAKKWAEGMKGTEDLGMDIRVDPTYHSPDKSSNRINVPQ